MKADKFRAMGDVMLSLVTPDIDPKDLMKAARCADTKPVKVREQQNFVLTELVRGQTALTHSPAAGSFIKRQ